MKINIKAIGLASIICLFLGITILPVPSSAAGAAIYDTTVSIENVKGAPGDVVDIPVGISKPTKAIAAYGLEINYNQKALKVVGIYPGYGKINSTCSDDTEGCFWSNYDNTKGFLRTAWADPKAGDHAITKAQTLFTVQVEILKTGASGENKLTVQTDNKEAVSFTGSDNQSLVVSINTGEISIKKSPAQIPAVKKPLPNTSTNEYNWIVAGGIFALLGVFLQVLRIKRKAD